MTVVIFIAIKYSKKIMSSIQYYIFKSLTVYMNYGHCSSRIETFKAFEIDDFLGPTIVTSSFASKKDNHLKQKLFSRY